MTLEQSEETRLAEDKKPVTYLLRNIPYVLNKKLQDRAKVKGRSKRVVILDALDAYFK